MSRKAKALPGRKSSRGALSYCTEEQREHQSRELLIRLCVGIFLSSGTLSVSVFVQQICEIESIQTLDESEEREGPQILVLPSLPVGSRWKTIPISHDASGRGARERYSY